MQITKRPDTVRIFRKPDCARFYEVTRRHRGRRIIGRVECPGILFQDNLSLYALEQVELILAVEGFTKAAK